MQPDTQTPPMSLVNCESCGGYGWIVNEADSGPCKACRGNGRRPINSDMLVAFTEAKEFIDEEIDSFFSAWCKASGIHPAYGVEDWDIYGDTIRITQDMTSRGCHDTDIHLIPLAMLFADREEMKRLVGEERKKKEAERAASQKRLKKDEIRRLQAQLEKLEAEGEDEE